MRGARDKTKGTLPDGATWEQQTLFEKPPPSARRPQRSRPTPNASGQREKSERGDMERRRRIDELIADGYCVALHGNYCGWRYGHSPNCTRR